VNGVASLVLMHGSGTTGCHGYVESHREQAYAEGWLIRRSDPRPACEVPLLTWQGWVLLLDDGTVQEVRSEGSRSG